jgi:hypothetical protein
VATDNRNSNSNSAGHNIRHQAADSKKRKENKTGEKVEDKGKEI